MSARDAIRRLSRTDNQRILPIGNRYPGPGYRPVQTPYQPAYVPASDLITAVEAARLLSVHPAVVTQMRLGGRLSPTRVGGRWFYDRAEVERLLRLLP